MLSYNGAKKVDVNKSIQNPFTKDKSLGKYSWLVGWFFSGRYDSMI